MSTHNIDFYEDLTKIIFQISSNMHLISSSDRYEPCHRIFVQLQRPNSWTQDFNALLM